MTEWGDKKNYRSLLACAMLRQSNVEKNDCYFDLKTFEEEFPLAYLTNRVEKS